jgi:hypothetical protein
LTDDSRAAPHTSTWLLYWTEHMGKYMSGELTAIPGGIPVEAFRAVVGACEAGQVDSPYARVVRGEDAECLAEGRQHVAPAAATAKA